MTQREAKETLAEYVVRLFARGLVAFALLAMTATNLGDLSELESAILIGAVFGAHDMVGKIRGR